MRFEIIAVLYQSMRDHPLGKRPALQGGLRKLWEVSLMNNYSLYL